MTQPEKQLLLIDLCSRLPYGVKATTTSNGWNGTYTITGYANDSIYLDCPAYDKGDDEWLVEFVKPYLRPMSSMTKEEVNQYCKIRTGEDRSKSLGELDAELFNFYHKNHIDCRGLISMGLALEAPEGMYKN